MTVGYSGTPLTRKLGIRPGDTIGVVGSPPNLAALLDPMPDSAELRVGLDGAPDVALFFTTERAELEDSIDALGEAIFPDRLAWVCWPKRASKVPTDMTEDVIREVALPRGLVDTKVAAVDATWSGLRLVWRRELRTADGPGAVGE